MSSLTARGSYFEYQRELARRVVLPWLVRFVSLEGARVADFGCHGGGMVEELRASEGITGCVGFDRSASTLAQSPFRPDPAFRLELRDLTQPLPDGMRFDLVIVHDVLEHVPSYSAIVSTAAQSLTPGGRVFVSVPPYYSAFGGHQQLARGVGRVCPWIHLLPEPMFIHLARPSDNQYMSAADSLGDMRSVRATRLTLSRLEHVFGTLGLAIIASEFFIVRPEHALRYPVPPTPAGPIGRLPLVREALVSGANYLLARA
jgi:SAM-dependent methyltransferase